MKSPSAFDESEGRIASDFHGHRKRRFGRRRRIGPIRSQNVKSISARAPYLYPPNSRIVLASGLRVRIAGRVPCNENDDFIAGYFVSEADSRSGNIAVEGVGEWIMGCRSREALATMVVPSIPNTTCATGWRPSISTWPAACGTHGKTTPSFATSTRGGVSLSV